MISSYTHENAMPALGLDESQAVRFGGACISMRLLSTKEVACEMGKSSRRVLDLCQLGRIVGAHKAGGKWRIPIPVIVRSTQSARGNA